MICNDDADWKAKSGYTYAESNTSRQKCQLSPTLVGGRAFHSIGLLKCALCVNYRKTVFQQFVVAYNNSYLILNRLPMRFGTIRMLVTDNVDLCTCVTRKFIYSLMTRIDTSFLKPNCKEHCGGDVRRPSVTSGSHYCIIKLCSFYTPMLFITYMDLELVRRV